MASSKLPCIANAIPRLLLASACSGLICKAKRVPVKRLLEVSSLRKSIAEVIVDIRLIVADAQGYLVYESPPRNGLLQRERTRSCSRRLDTRG